LKLALLLLLAVAVAAVAAAVAAAAAMVGPQGARSQLFRLTDSAGWLACRRLSGAQTVSSDQLA